MRTLPYFHVVLPCQLVLILWLYISQNSVLILCLRRLGKRYNNLDKSCGNDSRFFAGQQLSILTCTTLSRAEVTRGTMEKIVEVNCLVKALSKVLERSFAKKTQRTIKYEQIRQDLWKKPWWFCQETFGNTKSVVEYLGEYKIAISNHRIRSIDTQNVTLIIRIIGLWSTGSK
jgi:hypothetical protein